MNLNNIKIDGLIYLASPYSKYPHGRLSAWSAAARITAVMLEHDFVVFSPIAYSHQFEQMLLPREPDEEHEFWMTIDRQVMARCHALVVARLEGWEDSRGVAEEIETFRAAGKPIYLIDPHTFNIVPMEKH